MNRRDVLGGGVAVAAGSVLVRSARAERSFDRFRVAEWEARRRWLATRFGRIAYVDAGRGVPALFLHGYPLSGFQWRGAIEQLSLFNRCIAPDFLGLGMTEAAPDQPLDAASQTTMLVALLDALKLARVHVVASDSGIAVAQLLAVRHPARVRSLLLTNGDTERQSPPAAMRPVIALARAGRYAREWLGPWHRDPALARRADQFGGLCYADPRNPTDEAIAMYFGPVLANAERRRQVEAHAVAQETNALAGITPLLAACPVPARILWGVDDTIFDGANADFLDRAFAQSRGVRRIPGAKLFWPEERPGLIAEEAGRLWGEVRS